ncbi:hypothetical protein HGI30_14935 [Paenibacillus albicereus]|uniref:Uncharacterized protein n=1 Tax=Paenibacillus albicereus TaxID=2726185 RepID=A0A6H2GZA7_9BACL|nr:hypothetical protein [Paenibacillus albicereus]QJC52727.1 hypothetical protein HGI30_14935 [Paenibacillus albicereus]
MRLIDADKQLEWLERELHYSQRENRQDEAKALDMTIGKIKSGAFDPPTPEPPKFKAGDRVRSRARKKVEGTVTGYSESGKRVRVVVPHPRYDWPYTAYYAPEALELIEEGTHEKD